MKTLVTGAAGFIGTHLLEKLKESGADILGTDSFEEQVHGEWFKSGAEKYATLCERHGHFFAHSVGHLNHSILEGVDTVYHLAARVGVGQSMYRIHDYVEGNVAQTAHLLELLKESNVKRLIVASSMSIYGESILSQDRTPHLSSVEQDAPQNPNIYALTKYDQEKMCLIFGKAYGIETVALRFFNVIGEGQALSNPYTGVVAMFASALMNDKAPLIFEDGKQTRDFIHVSDIVQALILAQTLPSGAYNVGTGVATPIVQVAEMLAELMGKKIAPNITGQKRAGDIRHCAADISKIAAYGFKPKVPLREGLKRVVEWIKTQKSECRVEEAAKELVENGLLK